MKTITKHVGIILMAFAIIHLIVSFVLFGDWLVLIIRGGIGNLNWTAETLTAFWFLIFSWPLFLLGYTVRWTYRRTGQLPALLGWGIFTIPAVSVVFLPASGLWLFVLLGVLILLAAQQKEATR